MAPMTMAFTARWNARPIILRQVDGKPRQVLWRIYSKRAILAGGSNERPIAFGNNDRPGIMLASAVRTYANRFGVSPGKSIAIFTNNDDGWRTAIDLAEQGRQHRAIIDTRRHQQPLARPFKDTAIIMGGRIVDTKGRHGLQIDHPAQWPDH